MKARTTLAVLLGVLLAQPAWAASRSAEDIYATTCASCHGSDGKGVASAQTGLLVRPRDFTDCRKTSPEPDQDWYAVIAEGGPARGFDRLMPAFGEVLSDDEQKAVLGYIRGFCADPVFPRGDLNFPRPLVTEKAFVEDELVLNAAIGTQSPVNIDGRLIYERRFLRRQQVEVMVPFGIDKTTGGSREPGLGDIALGLKSALIANLDTGTILSVAGEVALPTGNQSKGFGTGVVRIEPFLALGQALPWDSFLHVQAGAEFPTKEASGVESEGFVRGALGTTLLYGKHGRSLSPMVEAVASRELTSGAPTTLDIVPQVQVALSRRQHILASVGAQIPALHRDGRNVQIMAYVLWDWFDGALWEGW